MTEDQLLSNCFQWHWNNYPTKRMLLFHVPNEGSSSKIRGGQMKAKGVVAGVSDFILLENGKVYCLECKTFEGKQSKQQKKFEQVCFENNIFYCIFRSLNEFKAIIKEIYEC